jgi:predicted transglutaminase-like protease
MNNNQINPDEIFFKIKTPLDVEVRTTINYWQYLIDIKHPIMKNKETTVKNTLKNPDEIRQSKIDKEIFLYYKKLDKLYCVVAKHIDLNGFLIKAYPTDKIKEGDLIWKK